MTVLYSPSVAAALAANPKLAEQERAHDESLAIPHPSTEAARELFFGDLGRPNVIPMPDTQTSRRELFEELVRADETTSKKLGFSHEALRAASTLDNTAQPDAIDSALTRIDALEERAARYRLATGDSKRLDEPGVPLSMKAEPSLVAEIETLARQRGSNRSETMRWLVRCGLILADERRKRYEAYMMTEIGTRAAAAGDGIEDIDERRDAQQAALVALEPHRYVDAQSPSLGRALHLADPFGGAPDEVRAVIPAPVVVSNDPLPIDPVFDVHVDPFAPKPVINIAADALLVAETVILPAVKPRPVW